MTNKLVKVGLIGFGRHVDHSMLPNMLANENTVIISLADLSEERREAAEHRFVGIKTYSTAEELLDNALNDGINSVVISMDPAGHVAYTKLALEAGLHVFVEKPVAIHSYEFDDLISLSEEKHLVTSVGTKWRYTEATKHMQKYTSENEGYQPKVLHLEATFPTLFHNEMWGLTTKTQITFYDMFVHAFDYIESWAENSEIKNAKILYDNDTTQVAHFELYNGEVYSLLDLVRGSQAYDMKLTATLENGAKLTMKNLTDIELIDTESWLGTEGSLRDEPKKVWSQGRLYRGYARAGYKEEWDNFVDSVLNNSVASTNLVEAKKAIIKIEKALESLDK
ncbi:Inositol 2-dehydrogenase/D-chiro-inositol 3-dehydrogenase [Periweissella fabaria]|uniref:Inositol 2-dehydrogenase/D-chiro-inositol 3-dehydrogenase n=1 Tax=Periweissella fabaria TaxID=546157 RepID=A0ABM8Z7W0_9LACO|nr:Gfo/Idh/MocA family oxidoreductase [Periweissella fabaria]CAH0417520.1 Inositol 2-dehydrogenase/D-chiro-inositol 3-dehydrogenase [Periweissella fabaria]